MSTDPQRLSAGAKRKYGARKCAAFISLLLLCMMHRSDSEATDAPLKLMLSTGTRLMWYTPSTGEEQVHYGVVPGVRREGQLDTVWCAVRDETEDSPEEFMVEIDINKGGELQRVKIDSSGTHDAVKFGDKVWAVETQRGMLLEMAWPNMTHIAHHHLFRVYDHINTIAPISETEMWVMLHNMGNSRVMRVIYDKLIGKWVKQIYYTSFGVYCHGLVKYGEDLLILDSDNGALVKLNTDTGCWERLYEDPIPHQFTKGLLVVDDVAYFGISEKVSRGARTDRNHANEVVAFHLVHRKVIWRRMVHSSALVNIVTALQLGDDAPFRAQVTSSPDVTTLPITVTLEELRNEDVLKAVEDVKQMSLGTWPTGAPQMDLKLKSSDFPQAAGVMLPLGEVDVKPMADKLQHLMGLWWDSTMQTKYNTALDDSPDEDQEEIKLRHQQYGPANKLPQSVSVWGKEILLMATTEGSNQTRFLPFYSTFAWNVEPIVKALLGDDGLNRIVRMALRGEQASVLKRVAPKRPKAQIELRVFRGDTDRQGGAYEFNNPYSHTPCAKEKLDSSPQTFEVLGVYTKKSERPADV
eukprot:gene17966-24371_t